MAAPKVQPPQASLTGTVIGRFQVGPRIGTGGMGEVYVAEDLTLRRKVALKRVSPALRDDPAHLARLFKEAQRASSLAHPCVASIFDVLQESGEIVLVMEYVEGISMRERLKQKPPADEVLRIIEQCAGALKAAHEKNLVHGDVKPENIMITAGCHAKLLDFGVARRIVTDSSQTGTTTTALQGWGGTPGYLAPEVLLEQPSDGRADLFSLGVVMYESLTGVQPFRGDSTVSTFDHTLHDEPLALHDVNPVLPAELGKIVEKLLAKRADQRYRDAEALLVDLRPLVAHASSVTFLAPMPRRPRSLWTVVIAALLVAIAAGAGWWISSVQKSQHALALPANRYLAVLPFKSAGSNPADQAFADGITSMLISNLSRLTVHQPLQIASAADTRRVADVQQAHRTLGVNLVLQGKVEHSGNDVRIDYSLVDARTLEVLRSDTLRVPGADPFALSDQLTAATTHLLAFDLGPEEQRGLSAHGTQQPEAYEAYLSGEGYRQQNTPQSIDSAVESLRLATNKDPGYALAWSSLGESYLQKFNVAHQREWLDQARESCTRATHADAREASGYVCLGEIETTVGSYDAAVKDFQQALAGDSTSDAAYSGLGEAFQKLNRLEDAERNYKHAVEIRPNFYKTHSALGHFYTIIGRYQDAVNEFTRATELAPDLPPPYWSLAGAQIYLGAYDAAISTLTKGIAIAPTPQQYSNLGIAYLGLHRYADAITAFEQASRMAGSDYRSLGNLARAYACAGESDRAKPVYRQAIELADAQVKVNPKDSWPHLMLAVYHGAIDDRAQAYKELSTARSLSPDYAELWFFTAIIDVHFGDRAGALKALEHALALGYSRSEVRTAPEFEQLHSNPDFQALARAQ